MRGEVFVEREAGGGWCPDGFPVLAFPLRASVEEEGEGEGNREDEDDDDYDGGYYATIRARDTVCCCII